jgi:omega-6 fatty acid desaturase (delta-12 desaturase)
METVKGPMWFIASVGHMIDKHFFPSSFSAEQRPRVYISLAAVYLGALFFFPMMYLNFGMWGIVKFWLIPWLGYHFWMSTFTMVHHTLPHIPFLESSKWSDVRARLTMTVHCEYPAWIEYLCHHINVHVPHHVSTGIPSYNLRMAHNSLKATWGKYMHETTFSWALLRDIISTCHLYDEVEAYKPFPQKA